ncbi:hypothetical protein DPMN_169423 [Dreissena polymorpha]|uniref:EGF-like domain-containing protein n=1 Tax=Dreissena polymorpha TaxID=45954 RepID=A0A9D4DV78_DREPO|nr:hypothetical protein DPMN_169423 [Dreissena polymorpha]
MFRKHVNQKVFLYSSRCPAGTYPNGYNCLPIDYCARDTPCFDGATCITKPHPENFTCVCPPRWTGRLCDVQGPGPVVMAGLTTSFIIIIIVSIFVVLGELSAQAGVVQSGGLTVASVDFNVQMVYLQLHQ